MVNFKGAHTYITVSTSKSVSCWVESNVVISSGHNRRWPARWPSVTPEMRTFCNSLRSIFFAVNAVRDRSLAIQWFVVPVSISAWFYSKDKSRDMMPWNAVESHCIALHYIALRYHRRKQQSRVTLPSFSRSIFYWFIPTILTITSKLVRTDN